MGKGNVGRSTWEVPDLKRDENRTRGKRGAMVSHTDVLCACLMSQMRFNSVIQILVAEKYPLLDL